MATNFPTSVDVLTNPVSNDSLNSPSHSAQHTNANDAIEAIEAAIISPATYPNQLVNATTATVRPLPFAMAAGTVTMTTAATVTLPVGRFTQTPIVHATNQNFYASGVAATAYASGTTSIQLQWASGTTSNVVGWTAIQMTSAASAG